VGRKKKPVINFPIFSIYGNYLDEDIEQAVNLRYTIYELSSDVDEINKELINLGLKLNLYINNIIQKEKTFDFTNEMILFTDVNEISFYPHQIVEDLLDKSNEEEITEEEICEKLPKTKNRVKLNSKQIKRCSILVDSYNELFIEYECTLCDLDECNSWYNFVIDGIKEELMNVKLFDIKSNNKVEELEPYNEDIHELLITKDADTKKWKCIYIHKDNREKFMEYVEYYKLLDDNK